MTPSGVTKDCHLQRDSTPGQESLRGCFRVNLPLFKPQTGAAGEGIRELPLWESVGAAAGFRPLTLRGRTGSRPAEGTRRTRAQQRPLPRPHFRLSPSGATHTSSCRGWGGQRPVGPGPRGPPGPVQPTRTIVTVAEAHGGVAKGDRGLAPAPGLA